MATGTSLEGTIIGNGQGQYKILKGGQWMDYNGAPPGKTGQRGLTGSNATLSPEDQKFLNQLSSDAQGANETARIYDRAETAIKRLGTGPYWGRLMTAATPEDNGGLLDSIGSVVIGGPARLTGAVTPQNTTDYQMLRSLQQNQVLQQQLRQKGVQTEGDAARIMLTDISPLKTVDANMQIINQGRLKAQRAQAKAQFYNQWANKYGLHGADPNGNTVDNAWAQGADAYTNSIFGKKATIKVVGRQRLP